MFDLYSEVELDKIRSLGKFYESIPDYYDIHHLSKKDFNSTLDRLKETSNKLKTKPISLDVTQKEKKKNQIHSSKETIGNICSDRNLLNISFSPSTTIPKGLKTFNKNTRRGIKKSYSLSHLYEDIQQLNLSNEWNSPKSNSKELKNIMLPEKPSKCNKIKKIISPIEDNEITDNNILRKYCNNSNIKKKRKPQINNSNKLLFLGLNMQKPPPGKGDNIIKAIANSGAPSPLYPAARLNLAATLRAEISHKKRYELNNSTNFRPKKNQSKFDWEVRKSPGWKTLTYCETHKDDLIYRLETRKAEQKLQKQEYKTNMELMRQRVKSAPLLLEGMTYWNSRLYNSKLAHNCANGKQSRLSLRCKYIKNSKNDTKHIENNQNIDSDDLSSEDRALL